MGEGPLYRVQFRRRREGKTDYRRRLALLKSEVPRVVVRRSLRNVTVQFVSYTEAGDTVVAQAQATELKKLGWTGFTANTPAAYLAGLLAGKRFLESGKAAEDEDGRHAVLDIGRQVPVKGGRIFAALAGVVEAGVKVPHGDILPTDDRVRGEHVQGKDYAAAFAATFEKIAGRAPPPKKEAPKKKADKGKGAAPQAPAKGQKQGGGQKPAGQPKPPKEKKAKSPE